VDPSDRERTNFGSDFPRGGTDGPTHASGQPEKDDRWLLSVVENSSEIVTIVDPDGTLRYANPAWQRVLGYDPEEEIGTMNVLDHVHPEDHPHVLEETEKAFSEEGIATNEAEYRFRHKDGSWRWMESVGTYLLEDPAVGGVVVTSRDVTKRKEAEKALKENETFVRQLLRSLPNGSVNVFDRDLRYLFAEGRGLEEVGMSLETLVGRTIQEAFSEEGLGLVEEHYRKAFSGEEVGFELPMGELAYEINAAPLHTDEDGEVRTIIAVARNITERKRAEAALRESEERLHVLADSAFEGILVTDEGVILEVNRALSDMSGYEVSEMVGRSTIEFVAPEHRDLVQKKIASGSEEPYEVLGVRKDGTLLDLEVRGRAYRYRGSTVRVTAIRDITERKKAEKRLEHQAFHDALTDLPNRYLFMDRLGHALARTQRRRGRRVAVLFMDLDGFKVVNDSLGHGTGDRLLVMVAERLKGCLRPEDTLARFGGDEFVVLLEDVDSPDEAVRVAERIIGELKNRFVLDGWELYVKGSIGIALGEDRTKDPEDLLRDADTAMYRAKDEGKGYSVFDPAMYDRVLDRLEAENSLGRAVEQEEFLIHYQPLVSLQTGEVSGVEALVRWEHPERGLLDPDEFVPMAEESGLVIPMGEQVLREACLRAKEWQEAHPRTPPLVMSVNLSVKQLSHPDLAETIEGILKETGLDASCLTLDVTETIYVRALAGNTATLDRLKDLGVRISIDDFGMGYSSLAYLKRLPADSLKIDRSFVKGLGEDVEDTAIVHTIIELAHTLGLEVIAEGVESKGQATLLREIGCDFAQGYHFARPLPPDEIPEVLSSGPTT
jgi:diguanylate cyclase (GGDEF)-like protein/PAS domain S-box-containing protein